MDRPITLLVLQILFLSSVAVGGFITTVPELHRFVVDVHGWLNDGTFVALFALAQAAPGPNMIVVTLVGWEIAGATGAALATAAACLPTLVIAYTVSRFWSRYNNVGWYRTFERGVAPFAVGLILATGVILTDGAADDWKSYALTGSTIAFMLFSRRSPLIPLAIAAAAGLVGFV
ncbi:chromate transporter [Microvirga brassicacearum]|uniref:Chromate transporter n=1 Tax=Microvirga brassicacearum TaxID=2580413 RepID=A0A5N3PGK8_9HYPH|nr:chromate transporter [Microvirga brassicacearum]KAB0268870.1 chromate transporter [Microvirga brassicacearum]